MATPLSRYPGSSDPSPMGVPAVPATAEYALPSTGRGLAAQVAASLGILTGLWVALSPVFLTLQHGGTNAATADVLAGLVTAVVGIFALTSPRGFSGLQFASLALGVWVLISPFILDEKFTIATPMFWSNSWSGAVLMVLALGALATLRPATRRMARR